MDLRKLAQDAEEIRTAPVEEEAGAPNLTPREIQFSLVYEAGGRVREAVITSRIMNGDERFKASRMAADIAGRPWNTLPANTQIHAVSLGTVAVQLRDAPEWVLEACQEDEELAVQLFASCKGHDARWFRGGDAAGSGGEEKPRIQLTEIGSPSY